MQTFLESLKSDVLLKALQYFVLLYCTSFLVGFTICAKGKTQKINSGGKKAGGKTGKKGANKTESDDDVKFNLNVKPAEQKRDEFDDDEENPLAKIPTKPRIPKQKQTTGTLGASTSRTSSTLGSKMEPEASFFAPHEKTTGASCYMVKTANQG
ncbi:unnamed protein product [Caenorhabditis nigoni]